MEFDVVGAGDTVVAQLALGLADGLDLATAVALEPESYDAVVGLGTALRGLGQFGEAQSQYERAKQIDGESSNSAIAPRPSSTGSSVYLKDNK